MMACSLVGRCLCTAAAVAHRPACGLLAEQLLACCGVLRAMMIHNTQWVICVSRLAEKLPADALVVCSSHRLCSCLVVQFLVVLLLVYVLVCMCS